MSRAKSLCELCTAEKVCNIKPTFLRLYKRIAEMEKPDFISNDFDILLECKHFSFKDKIVEVD